jgi:hypothetical protein
MTIEKVMYDQMKNNPWNSVECEPDCVFPECNQHPILSFMLYDHTHGTNLTPVRDLFLDFFLKNKLIDPNTHQTAMLYLVKQKVTIAHPVLESPTADSWTGALCMSGSLLMLSAIIRINSSGI